MDCLLIINKYFIFSLVIISRIFTFLLDYSFLRSKLFKANFGLTLFL